MTAAAPFRHEALLYRGGPDGFARAVAPLVTAALDAGGAAAVAAPPDRLDRLRSAVGSRPRLELVDMHALGVNPGRIIPAWRALADRALAEGPPFLGIGEPVWAGRTDDEIDECQRHEALINDAFRADPPWRLVCPYDADALPADVLDAVRSTHPEVVDAASGRTERCAGDLPHGDPLAGRLPAVPEHAATLRFRREELAEVRRVVLREAKRAVLDEARTADLLLAAIELATNSVRHAGGQGTLRVWRRDGAVVCQVSDEGRITDALVGRRRPGLDLPSGRGLWVVHQLCDLVHVRSSERGTTVRISVG